MVFWGHQFPPKKWANNFDYTTMIPQVDLFSFVFWRKSMTPKNHFEINWPLPCGCQWLTSLTPDLKHFFVEKWTNRYIIFWVFFGSKIAGNPPRAVGCQWVPRRSFPYLSLLDFWKIELEKSSLMNWIFCLFQTWILEAPQAVNSNVKLDLSKIKCR